MNTRAKRIASIFAKLLVGVFLAIECYPIFWLLMSSLKRNIEFVKPMYCLPEGFYWQNYTEAWKIANMGVLFKNTVIVTLTSVTLSLIMSAMAAFAITRMKWRLSGLVSSYFLIGMFIPAFVLLLPQFLMFGQCGILNTHLVLIIIFSSGLSLQIFLLNGFYRYIPSGIMEAAVMDGCGIYRTFWHVAVPMSLNGYVTVVMLMFYAIWNDLLISQTFTSSQNMKMLQVGLAAFTTERGSRDWGPTFAAIAIAILPTMSLYLVLNKKIIDGLAAGAIKG